MSATTPQIRPFQPFDLPGMYDVCLRTGDGGRDARPIYRNPHLIGHLYAGPYPVADPGLTFVVADAAGVAGYVVGTADTVGFERWLDEHWRPGLRAQYPEPRSEAGLDLGSAPGPDLGSEAGLDLGLVLDIRSEPGPQLVADDRMQDAVLVRRLHHPEEIAPADVLARYPAHLHIDLLPRAQGGGLGRRLITALADALRERGIPGVHLGVEASNTGARAFYARIGFTVAQQNDGGALLVLPLS
ncbi:GNAT family N-acetyltransferase [Cellulomonas hominis]